MTVVSVTDQTFENEVVQSQSPVLVDLFADWCQPCKQVSPIVEEVSNELEGKLKVCKVDVDHNPRIAQALRVQSLPTLMVIHQGQIAGHRTGLVDKKTILDMVESVLPSDEGEVKPAELAQLLSNRRAMPVDVRDSGSFGRHRIPGAINVPADTIFDRTSELRPPDGRIPVLYGRSGDEAKQLVAKLREQGLEVGFLSGGFLGWETEGLEVEHG